MTLLLALLAAAQDADFFPLKAGSEWSYTLSTGQAMTIRVTGTAKVKGVECAVVETEMAGQKARESLAVTAEGLKAFKMENAAGAVEFDEPVLRVKLPLKKGETWKVTLQEGSARNTYTCVCEGTETLTVAGTAVECVKIVTTLATAQGPATMSTWYGRGVGLLRQVYSLGPQTMTAELARTNVRPAAAPVPVPAASDGSVVRYESKDGKVLLFHPKDWKVSDGALFGEGSYAVSIGAPDDNAGALFLTFALTEQLKDSVDLANLLLANLAKTYPTLQVSEMSSTKDRARTSVTAAYAQGEKKIAARLHFFHTPRAATVYAILAREDLFAGMKPTLAAIAANLAYAPEGVAKVLQQGRQAAAAAPRPSGDKVLHPAVMIQEALARGGKVLDLVEATAQDGSFSMAVPRGWTFQGAGLAWTASSDARLLHGAGSVWHTITVPGTALAPYAKGLQSRYLPPPQAIAAITQAQNTARNLRVLSACPETDLDPNANATWAQARAQGSQVDNRVLLVEFENVATGQTCRGIFSVTCISYPMGTSWSCAIGGSWAPAGEFEALIPTFAKVHGSTKQNSQWVQGRYSAQAAESKRLNQNLMTSISEVGKSYDRYNQSWHESQKSRDYTSWAWSQTTLGQGSWVSEREGAEVVRSASWGLENTQTGQQTSAWNTTTFNGRNPWSGEQLNEVNTRGEYEQLIRRR